MLQAEVGNAKLVLSQDYPTRGHLFPDFSVSSTDGKRVSPYDYSGDSNLLLIFAGDHSQTANKEFVAAISRHYFEIRECNAEVLLVLGCSGEQAKEVRRCESLPFVICADEVMRIHQLVGALDTRSNPATAVYVTDRFLEVFAAWRGAEENLPSASQILSWLEYLESQCPERTQIEWPTDE